MKYCVKCGNRMEDDMLFCQKCGTKSNEGENVSQNDIEIKINKMKQYNLALDSSVVTWEYLCEDGNRSGTIAVQQDKMSEELAALISGILKSANKDEMDFVEREVYTFALKSACKLCRESEKFYADYTGFGDVFKTAKWAADVSKKPQRVLAQEMCDLDYPYKATIGLQSLYASRLKDVLDENVIYENLEYRTLTKELAEAFNLMWKAGAKRYIDFLASVPTALIDQSWSFYEVIIKGLPIFVVDALDESGWDLAINDVAVNQGNISYKQNFLQKRNQQRDNLRKLEDERYWVTHPSEYAIYSENLAKISEINSSIKVVEAEIQSINANRQSLSSKKAEYENKITEAQRRIEKLSGKIFGKKKAEEEIKSLYEEINNLTVQVTNVQKNIEVAVMPLTEKKEIKSNLEAEVQLLQKENICLRNG